MEEITLTRKNLSLILTMFFIAALTVSPVAPIIAADTCPSGCAHDAAVAVKATAKAPKVIAAAVGHEGHNHDGAPCPSEKKKSANDNIRMANLEEIEKSMPAEPISVGFDVDDTILFSSPGFHYAFNNTDGPDGSNLYGKKPLSSDKFWQDMSSQFDKFSMPKESARKLLKMHQKRGDKIFFITARPEIKGEILTGILNRTFRLKNEHPVIFSGKTSKAEYIKANNIKVFYGDSDSDISEAQDAGIRGIRVERSPISTNKGKYHPGKHGEWVMENSAE
jgi:acid phosphatase (class B)